MPYIIILNHLEGVELITRALLEQSRSKGCIASSDLAEGIAANTLYEDPITGKSIKLSKMGPQVQNNKPSLKVIQ